MHCRNAPTQGVGFGEGNFESALSLLILQGGRFEPWTTSSVHLNSKSYSQSLIG